MLKIANFWSLKSGALSRHSKIGHFITNKAVNVYKYVSVTFMRAIRILLRKGLELQVKQIFFENFLIFSWCRANWCISSVSQMGSRDEPLSRISQIGVRGRSSQRLGNFVAFRQKIAILALFESHFARY